MNNNKNKQNNNNNISVSDDNSENEDDFFISDENEINEDDNSTDNENFNSNEISDNEYEEESENDIDNNTNLKPLDSDDEKTIEEKKIISKQKIELIKQKIKKSGVIYLSKIPPYMKPEKLKSMFSKYGEVNRIYLVPEDKTVYKRRVKKGGNKNMKYIEGWVEFVDKKIAKDVAEILNNQIVGGKKRNYYHDDIWNIKYLKGFKWTHLTEKLSI